MKLVGLGKEPISDESTFCSCGSSVSVPVKPEELPNVFKSTFHTGATLLLLQVKVTLPFSGTHIHQVYLLVQHLLIQLV